MNCRFCRNKIFMECLRNRDTLRTKELLHFFGLMTKTPNEKGILNWGLDNTNPNKLSAFFHMFNVDSPFGIVCDVCITKFTGQQNNHDENGNDQTISHKDDTSKKNMNDSLVASIIESVSNSMKEVLNGNLINLEASLSTNHRVETNVKPIVQPIVPPLQGEDGLFSLYVSKADTKATEDSIVSYVIEKIDISSDVFKVKEITQQEKISQNIHGIQTDGFY